MVHYGAADRDGLRFLRRAHAIQPAAKRAARLHDVHDAVDDDGVP
jgi:hypothetical protein